MGVMLHVSLLFFILLLGRYVQLATSTPKPQWLEDEPLRHDDEPDSSPSVEHNGLHKEPIFDDSIGEISDEPSKISLSDEAFEEEHRGTETAAPPKKNIFIYVPFRPTDLRSKRRVPTSTTRPPTTTSKPTIRTTTRKTFSSPWPPRDSPSLRSISRSSPEYKAPEKWRPVSSLKESASSSIYTQSAVPPAQSPTQVLQSPPTQIVQSPATVLFASSPQQSFFPQQQSPQQVQVLQQSPPIQYVQQTQPPHEVRVVESPPQPEPVQLNVVQSPPQPASPVHLNIVRAAPQAPTVHVNFVRSPPPQTVVHHHQPVFHAAPIVHQRLIQAPPVHTHFAQPPVVHAHAHPVLHTPVLHAVAQAAPHVYSPLAIPSAPPCAAPVFASPVPTHHTFFSPPLAQRTRTVYQQVQFVPEQTHVYTTTSFTPATRTTIYEADHVGAYSAPKPHVVRAPVIPVVQRAAPFVTESDARATIYTFPKLRVLGAPFRLAGRLSSRRQLRQKLREERRKQKYLKEKEKKIFVFNERNAV